MSTRLRFGVAVSVVALAAGMLWAPPAVALVAAPPLSSPVAAVPDANSEPTEASATVVAAKFGHPVVVDADTTPTEQVSALADGTLQLTENTVPVRVKTQSGWTPIDTTLAKAADGLCAPKATNTRVEFGAGGDLVLARVQTRSGAWLDEGAPFGNLPTPTVAGSAVTYPGVLPGVDLVLTATADGMSEVLVIKSAVAALNPALKAVDFSVSGAALDADLSGLETATASDGSKVIATSPTWWDSSDGSTVDGPAGDAGAAPVSQVDAGSQIALDARAAASTAGVQYPVYVDPSWTGGLQAYTYVDLAYPTQSYWNGNQASGQQRTGYVSAAYSPQDGLNHTARSLWQVDTSGVEGKHIMSSSFSVTEDWSFSCTASEVDLYWSGTISSATTWNNQPGLVSYLSNAVTAHGYNSSCPTAPVAFDATAGVQGAANANATGLTLELKAADETKNVSWKRFNQSATLTVIYNSYPNVPSSLSVASPPRVCGTSTYPAFLNGSQAVNLQASISDVDGGNVSGNFYLSTVGSTGSPTLYSSPFGSQGTQQVTIPSGTLTAGTTYAWYVQASDGTDVSASSSTCYFTVKNTSPALPTVTRTGAVAATVGAPMTVQFGSATADHVWVFAYWWAVGAPTSPSPAVPVTTVTTSSSLPSCGTTAQSVTFVCPDASGNSPVVSVAPIDDTSTLWVASYDAAGNVSKNAAGTSSASGLEVDTGADTTNVSFTSGHGWITDGLSSPIPSTVLDANTTSGTSLTSAHNLTLPTGTTRTATAQVFGSPPSTPVLSWPGFTELDRYISSSTDHGGYIESQAPNGYSLESSLGQLAALVPSGQAQPANTVEFFSCPRSNGDEMTSTSASCEGTGTTGVPLGYAWISAAGVPSGIGSVAMYRCYTSAGDHFDSLASNCEGQSSDGILGYLATLNATSTGQVIDTTKSFTVSAWLNPSTSQVGGRTYTAISESGTSNSAFALVQSGGIWLFCVATQTIPAAPNCAPGPAVSLGSWTYVTGIWDAVNNQARLLIGHSSTPYSVTPYTPASGSTSATGSLLIGSGLSGGAPAYQWNGLIDDPTVFQGVVDGAQLNNLYYQSAP